MGASESKLVFKQGIFRLSEEKEIPADDPYWTRVSDPQKKRLLAMNVHGIGTDHVSSSGSCLNPPKMFSAYSHLRTFDERETMPCPTLRLCFYQSHHV